MSTGVRLPFAEAYALAEQAAKALAPHVVRIKAVGSLRRRKPDVGDLELLCEPRMIAADLFGTPAPDVLPIRKELEELGTWVKGAERMMQITDLLGRPGLQLDLYLIHPPSSYGAQMAIRTGPADLGHLCMNLLRERGYGHRDGHVFRLKTGERVETAREEDWFELAGIPCLRPIHREEQVVELTRQRFQQAAARRGAYSRR